MRNQMDNELKTGIGTGVTGICGKRVKSLL